MGDSKTKKLLSFAGEIFQGLAGGAAMGLITDAIKSGAKKLNDEITTMDVKKLRVAVSGNLELDDENLYATALARVRKQNYALASEAEIKLAQLTPYRANLARLAMLGEPYVGDIDNQEAKKAHKEARIQNCMEQIEMIAEFDDDEWANHKTIMSYNEQKLDDKLGGLVGKLRRSNKKVAKSRAVKAMDDATKDNWAEIRKNFGI